VGGRVLGAEQGGQPLGHRADRIDGEAAHLVLSEDAALAREQTEHPDPVGADLDHVPERQLRLEALRPAEASVSL